MVKLRLRQAKFLPKVTWQEVDSPDLNTLVNLAERSPCPSLPPTECTPHSGVPPEEPCKTGRS